MLALTSSETACGDVLIAPASATAGTIPPASTAVSSAATTTLCLGAGFVYLYRAASHTEPIQFGNRTGRILARSQFHEPESARLPGGAVPNHTRRRYVESFPAEQLLQSIVRLIERQVPYVQLCHVFSFGLSTTKKGEPRPRTARPELLETGDVFRLQALRPLRHLKFHRLSFVEASVAFRLDRAEMDKYVLTGLALDESEPFAGVKPLHYSLFFQFISLLSLSYLVLQYLAECNWPNA